MNNKKGLITIKKRTPTENCADEISVWFDGHNEGSLTSCKDMDELERRIKEFLVKYPKAKIINEIAYGKVQDDGKSRSEPLTKPKISKEKPKNSQNTDDRDEMKKAEEKAEKEFEKALKKISNNKSSDIIEKFYEIPKHYARMVALGHRRGLILYGNAGLGKSYNTKKAFEEVGVNFKYACGHITNLALYQFLYDNRKEHIILDDVNILDNEINLNMLKSALNDYASVVSYNTTSGKMKVPSQFLFEGSITILLNKKPKNNASLEAVESRILVHELKFNYNQKLMLMKQISLIDYEDMTEEDREKVFNWIKENTNASTNNFNLRDLFKLYDFYRYNKEEWKILAQSIFVKEYALDLIIQGLGVIDWCEQTGKSRKTYFNYKRKLKNVC